MHVTNLVRNAATTAPDNSSLEPKKKWKLGSRVASMFVCVSMLMVSITLQGHMEKLTLTSMTTQHKLSTRNSFLKWKKVGVEVTKSPTECPLMADVTRPHRCMYAEQLQLHAPQSSIGDVTPRMKIIATAIESWKDHIHLRAGTADVKGNEEANILGSTTTVATGGFMKPADIEDLPNARHTPRVRKIGTKIGVARKEDNNTCKRRLLSQHITNKTAITAL